MRLVNAADERKPIIGFIPVLGLPAGFLILFVIWLSMTVDMGPIFDKR